MEEIGISFVAGVKYKESIYASAREVNGLFRLDLSTKKLIFLKKLSREDGSQAEYMNAFLYKNEIWFIPGYGESIATVNLDTLDIEYRKFPFKKINKKAILDRNGIASSYYLSGEIVCGRYLYLVPKNIDTLLVIDLETKKFYPYYGVIDIYGGKTNATYANGNIYLLPETENRLDVINLKTKEMRKYLLQESYKAYTGIVFYNSKLWIIPEYAECILSVDLDTYQNVEKFFIGEYHSEKSVYYQCFKNSKELFLIPYLGSKILKFNMDDKQLSEISVYEKNVLKNEKIGMRKLFSDDIIILDCILKNRILVYETIQDCISSVDLSIRKDIAIELLYKKNYFGLGQQSWCDSRIENYWGVEIFLNIITERELLKNNISEKIGEKIWKSVKI